MALAIARRGSVAGAAKELGVNATTVARRLRALNEALGIRVFERHAEGLRPTVAGKPVLEAAERMELEVLHVQRTVADADRRVEGTVRVTTLESLAVSVVSSALAPLVERYPQLRVELNTSDDVLDLTRSAADLAVRPNPGQQEGLVARKLARVGYAVYASAAYLERYGRPKTPADVRGHRCIGFGARFDHVLESRWLAERLDGRPMAYRSDSTHSLVSACAEGVGLAVLPCYVAEHRGDLVRIFGPDQVFSRDFYAVMLAELRKVTRIRAVVDHLVDVFARNEAFLATGVRAPKPA